jgi:hypothetical protein
MAEQNTVQATQIADLTSTVTQLVQGLQSAQAPPAPPIPPELQTDFNSRLIENPEGTINNLIDTKLSGVTPILGNMLGSGSQAIIGLRAQTIDQEFGVGAWAQFFESPMNTIQENRRTTNPASLMDQGLIEGDINGLKGLHLDKLVEFRTKSRETAATAATEGQTTLLNKVLSEIPNRTNLTGGIIKTPDGSEAVTPELEGYLKERSAATGQAIDPKAWLQKTNYGASLEDYQEHQKVLAKEEEKT